MILHVDATGKGPMIAIEGLLDTIEAQAIATLAAIKEGEREVVSAPVITHFATMRVETDRVIEIVRKARRDLVGTAGAKESEMESAELGRRPSC